MLCNLWYIKLISIHLFKCIESWSFLILCIVFYDIYNISALIWRYHFTTEEWIPALCLHFIKLFFCQILLCYIKWLEQWRKWLHKILISFLCAVINHYLIWMIHSVFFQIFKCVHSDRNSFFKRNSFQICCVNRIIKYSCKLLNLWNRNHLDISFSTLRIITIFKIILPCKQAFRIYPCNMLIPMIYKRNYICIWCTTGCCSP